MTDAPISKLSKALLWDYFILIARIWLAIILIKYGYSKLIDGQFGVTDATMQLKLKDVVVLSFPISLYFYPMKYLFLKLHSSATCFIADVLSIAVESVEY